MISESGQIQFNNKKSYDDFGLKIETVDIGYPSPRIIKEQVAGMNGYYDFSNVNGEITYDNRPITIKFVHEKTSLTKTKVNELYSRVVEWLYGSGENKLYIDYVELYFVCRVIEISSVEELEYGSSIMVNFDAYPFRIKPENEGDSTWDMFNFERDVIQDTKYTVLGSEEITLYNIGSCSLVPEVICSSQFSITKDNRVYKFSPGTNKNYMLSLKKGKNILLLEGNGDIEFKFRIEVI
jgi:hypothetical protein